MIIKIILIVGVVFIAFIILSLVVYNKDVNKRMQNRKKVEYVLIQSRTPEGKNIDNAIFLDKKITMVNIWGTYCPSCIKELPYLQEIYNEFKEEEVGMLGVIIDLNTETPKQKILEKTLKILDESGVKYPNVLLDTGFKEYISDKVFLIPTSIFVDSKGNVIGDIIESAYAKEEYIKIIKELLNNPNNHSAKIEHPQNNCCTIDGNCNINQDSENS